MVGSSSSLHHSLKGNWIVGPCIGQWFRTGRTSVTLFLYSCHVFSPFSFSRHVNKQLNNGVMCKKKKKKNMIVRAAHECMYTRVQT